MNVLSRKTQRTFQRICVLVWTFVRLFFNPLHSWFPFGFAFFLLFPLATTLATHLCPRWIRRGLIVSAIKLCKRWGFWAYVWLSNSSGATQIPSSSGKWVPTIESVLVANLFATWLARISTEHTVFIKKDRVPWASPEWVAVFFFWIRASTCSCLKLL